MKKIYFLCGIQGSGKTTYAKNHSDILNAEIVSTDTIRINYSPIEEKDVFPTAYRLITKHILEGKNVIFDATNINRKVRKENIDNILSVLDQSQIELICICFKIDKEICKKRVEKRNTLKGEIFLPLEVIDNFVERFEEPTLDEGFNEIVFVK